MTENYAYYQKRSFQNPIYRQTLIKMKKSCISPLKTCTVKASFHQTLFFKIANKLKIYSQIKFYLLLKDLHP